MFSVVGLQRKINMVIFWPSSLVKWWMSSGIWISISRSVSSLVSLLIPVNGSSPSSSLPPGMSHFPALWGSLGLLLRRSTLLSLTMNDFTAILKLFSIFKNK